MNIPISHTTAFIYRNLLKPLYFQLDAEWVHESHTTLGEVFGKIPLIKHLTQSYFSYSDPRLSQKIKGITFSNPIGLAAGFDYDARLTQVLGSVGFGFMSIGSVTAYPYVGNPPPMLGRLPKSKGLLVNKGLKSKGTPKIIEKLAPLSFDIPIGVSIARTNSKNTSNDREGIADYVESFRQFEDAKIASYFELNISCPNTYGGEPFTTPQKLNALLKEIAKLKIKTPLFIKMPVDFSPSETLALTKVAEKYTIAGFIFGNLTKDRKNPAIHPSERNLYAKGNISGKPTFERSNNLIHRVYKRYKKNYVIIGCGGVFSAEDAYLKIKLGSTLIQMITGMIYEGPQIIGQINAGLVKLLQKDGFDHISQAIGTAV